MEKDLRKYLSKHTSMSMIKVDELPKCERDIEYIIDTIDSGSFLDMEFDLNDYERGIAYFFGIGDIRDDETGMKYLRAAAEEGNTDAMNLYGFACYHTSLGCKDFPEKQSWYEGQAVRWFEEATKLGHVEAMFNLAVCFFEGKGTDVNEASGYRYMETAKKKGHPRASLYIEEYNERTGKTPTAQREADLETVLTQVCQELLKEVKELGIKEIYVTGLFNDIYLEKGYKWIKDNKLGWICSKDEGKTYLLREEELRCIEIG